MFHIHIHGGIRSKEMWTYTSSVLVKLAQNMQLVILYLKKVFFGILHFPFFLVSSYKLL